MFTKKINQSQKIYTCNTCGEPLTHSCMMTLDDDKKRVYSKRVYCSIKCWKIGRI